MNRKAIIRDESGQVVVKNAMLADETLYRMKGLMFAREMPNCEALIIDPCNSIHTFFMKFSLDVVFLNRKDVIVKVIKNMKPWRISGMYFSSRKVIEMKAGTMPSSFEKGKRIVIECIN